MQYNSRWSTSAARGKLVNLVPRKERCDQCGKPFDAQEWVRREGSRIFHQSCKQEYDRLRDLGMLE